MANRKFTQEFKDSTIQLALNSEKSVLKIGADLDVR
jgi:transposase-like protein